MKKYILVFLLSFPVLATGQTAADCLGAVAICDTVFSLPVLPVEQNEVTNEINTNISCLGTGDTRGRWYRFGTLGPGTLSFTITPVDTTYDFDWELFQLHYVPCTQIFGDTSLSIRCDFSGSNGTDGSTGADGLTIQGHQPVVNVPFATVYYLYISSAGMDITDTLGYTISFSGSTFTFDDCGSIGVEEQEGSVDIVTYPNPTSGKVYFTIGDAGFVPTRCEVVNMQGQLVAWSDGFWNPSDGIDFGLSPGLYYCRLIDSKGIAYTKKLIVN